MTNSQEKKRWQIDTDLPLASGAGIGDGIVVIVSRKGDVAALQLSDGKKRWTANIKGEVLANPVVGQGKVVIKSIDGNVRALSADNGHLLWTFQQIEPSLLLRGSSSPILRDRSVIVGFANGNLAKVSSQDGQLIWMQPVATPTGAFAIERMIDIDADPIMYGHRVFAATYQGKIASLEWSSGRVLWSHDLSSYTGMVADNDNVYISDAKSFVWSFGDDSGLVNWRQTALEARNVSGPASMGNYVVVGDSQGYLHWLGKTDGHFAAREFAGSAIYATPVAENNVLYALTNNGYLMAYQL